MRKALVAVLCLLLSWIASADAGRLVWDTLPSLPAAQVTVPEVPW